MEETSEASYCEKESWEDWASHSSLSQVDEIATQTNNEDLATLRAERDSLARALTAEKQRAATAARAHDARLAELHGVIAELVRRRAADKRAKAIPEEEVSDECESTTQPAGELENDADMSQTEQNDNSSLLSPAELPTPQDPKLDPLPDDTDVSTIENIRQDTPKLEVSPPQGSENCSSLMLSERDSEICVSTARCCQFARAAHSGGSCERERGSPGFLPPSPGRCESREAKVAARVRLRRTEDTESNNLSDDEVWSLALDACARADLRNLEGDGVSAAARAWRARCVRLAADCRVLDAALARAVDTAHRLSCACALQESSSVALCSALRAADRALETYDVLLALQESSGGKGEEREAAEAVARRLLARLQAAPAWGEPLLSPGPWQTHTQSSDTEEPLEPWTAECESRLRAHAARLKSDTAALRALRPPPKLYSPHDMDDEEGCIDTVSMAEMEAAVMMQEMLIAKEAREIERANAILQESKKTTEHKDPRRRRHKERHWLETQASETDL